MGRGEIFKNNDKAAVNKKIAKLAKDVFGTSTRAMVLDSNQVCTSQHLIAAKCKAENITVPNPIVPALIQSFLRDNPQFAVSTCSTSPPCKRS